MRARPPHFNPTNAECLSHKVFSLGILSSMLAAGRGGPEAICDIRDGNELGGVSFFLSQCFMEFLNELFINRCFRRPLLELSFTLPLVDVAEIISVRRLGPDASKTLKHDF